jgi:oligoribonuclease
VNTYPEKGLVWIDVETTGLDTNGDLLLEVACLVSDLDLNEIDPAGYQSKVLWPATALAERRARAVPAVQTMHDRSGLWSACSDPDEAKPVTQVDAELTAYVRNLVPEAKTARIAGSSVRLDLNFVDAYLPNLSGHLHYRMLDVSSWAGGARWWAGVEEYPKVMAHTAMADISESIEQMRWLRRQLGLGPAATSQAAS